MKSIIISVLLFISAVNSERILCLFGVSSHSYNNIFTPLTLELAARGHNLTVVTAYPIKNTLKNYHQIKINHVEKFFYEINSPSISVTRGTWQAWLNLCPDIYKHDEVKKLLYEKFDLIIINPRYNECCLPFVSYYNVPFIYISPNVLFTNIASSMGIPEPVSYVPNYYLSFPDQMTFIQRFKNLLFRQIINLVFKFVYYPKMNTVAKDFFGPYIPLIEDIEKNVSLALVNTDISWHYPKPTLPNVIEIGGIHIKPKNDPLPRDIQEFLDNAAHGVIYFSMGSILRGDLLPERIIKILLDTFKSLPQNILWKFESENLINIPSNVKIAKWLPQQDILAHPNVKLFITHGGLLSTQESVYYGVPMIGMPVYSDQPSNMLRNEQLGFAKTINLKTITKNKLINIIKTILANPIYKENAMKIRNKVRDKPANPLTTAVFWTEYVMRHNGADVLRSVANKLLWYQLYSLDVLAFLIIVLILLLFIVKFVCRKVYCCIINLFVNNKKIKEI